MRTIRIKLYKFSELSDKAKDKAIQHSCYEYRQLVSVPDNLKNIERIHEIVCRAGSVPDNDVFLNDGTLFTPPVPTVKQ